MVLLASFSAVIAGREVAVDIGVAVKLWWSWRTEQGVAGLAGLLLKYT
jgi:hypothetical protein